MFKSDPPCLLCLKPPPIWNPDFVNPFYYSASLLQSHRWHYLSIICTSWAVDCKFITFRQVTIPHTKMWDVSFGLGVKNVAKLQLALSPPAALEFFQSASPACSVVRRKGHSIKDFHCARQIDSPERAECPEVHWCFNVKPHTHTHTLPRPAFEILTEYYSSRLKLLPRHLSCILGAIYIDCCCSAGSRRVCCGIM